MKMMPKMKNVSHRYNVSRTRSRHGQKYTKYKMSLSTMMVMCNKQGLSNIWSSIHEKVKKHKLSWKKALLIKNLCIGQNALGQSDCRIFKSPFSPEQIGKTASFVYVDKNSQKLKVL